MIVHFKNQLSYEKENYKYSGNESSVSALEYNFLISKNNTFIKMKKQTPSHNSCHYHAISRCIYLDYNPFYLTSENAH